MYCTGSIPVAPYHGGNDGKRKNIINIFKVFMEYSRNNGCCE